MAALGKYARKLFSGSDEKDSASGADEHKQIEARMKAENEKEKRVIRVLLLGPGDSGKTTIVKQMKKIHNVLEDGETAMMQSYIRNACVSYMKLLCTKSVALHAKLNAHTLVAPQLEPLRSRLERLKAPYQLTKALAGDISTLWHDEGIRETLRLRAHFQIHDNVEYFLDKIGAVAAADYVPSFCDYLRIRTRSTGFSQTRITATVSEQFGTHTFDLIDVGGQRCERKKWMRLICDDVHALLYVVALSDYDLRCFEDNATNRLVEAITLFGAVLARQAKLLTNKSVILFFNKYDVFRDKVKRVPITVVDEFADFPAEMDPNDEDDVVRFVAGKFLQVFEDKDIRLAGPLHILRTTALDTDNVEKVFGDIQIDLVKQNLRSYGIM